MKLGGALAASGEALARIGGDGPRGYDRFDNNDSPRPSPAGSPRAEPVPAGTAILVGEAHLASSPASASSYGHGQGAGARGVDGCLVLPAAALCRAHARTDAGAAGVTAFAAGTVPRSGALVREEELIEIHGNGVGPSAASAHNSGGAVGKGPARWEMRRALCAALNLPCVEWLSRITAADARGDLVVGITVAVVLVPQAIAYALLANLPPVYGLYTSLVPMVAYALAGRSPHLCVGPFALMSMVVGSIAADIVTGGTGDVGEHEAARERYLQVVLALTVLCGLVQIAMGMLGLGVVANLLADSSVSGFTTAAALLIGASQLKHVLGAPLGRGSLLATCAEAVRAVATGRANPWAVLLTGASLCLMLGLKHLNRRLCARAPLFEQLVAVVVFTALAEALRLPVSCVGDGGDLPRGLPALSVPALPESWAELGAVVQGGATCALVSFLGSASIVRTFAARHGYSLDVAGELVPLGLANLAGGFFGAYPAAGSLSRSALASSLGARTPLHGAVQAVVIAAVLVGLTPLFNPLPYSVLAAVILSALTSLFDFAAAAELRRTSPSDFRLWLAAFLATAVFGVQAGLAFALATSLAVLIGHAARPAWAVLGRLPGTDVFRDVDRYPTAQTLPGVLIFRFDSPLQFANADWFASVLRERAQRMADGAATDCTAGVATAGHSTVKGDRWKAPQAGKGEAGGAAGGGHALTHVVLDCTSIHSLDSSAHVVLKALVSDFSARHTRVLLAAAPPGLRAALEAHGTLGSELLPHSAVFISVCAAITHGCGGLERSDWTRCGAHQPPESQGASSTSSPHTSPGAHLWGQDEVAIDMDLAPAQHQRGEDSGRFAAAKGKAEARKALRAVAAAAAGVEAEPAQACPAFCSSSSPGGTSHGTGTPFVHDDHGDPPSLEATRDVELGTGGGATAGQRAVVHARTSGGMGSAESGSNASGSDASASASSASRESTPMGLSTPSRSGSFGGVGTW